ncbi:hypothetical protein H3Z85_02965 [Chryseobacterium indologenes]|uniref:hypothetical protein n=1 Tax=Chryseobacterium TaxID=59732 RepID=UPI0003E080C8|nr:MULTISPECIES: hypothetical protein [Chryseobacterium]ATN06308.1 hypothetical protein CRN76_13285 [Chryseobacterium indologenes]AYY84930.1 hypothetical protein EGX91_10440 [Chryseobacterium indologenes]AYZ34600.1 hypothetical protein EGY07_02990 [Chryseobacterium indologenes]MBF6643175.1 hypothetical protein [Chryseobacterium indologenes]MBU3048909.1 hypothetical protein [Chryseobacterium indologenes]
MKKITLFIFLLVTTICFSQSKVFVVYNYSDLKLEGRLTACNPTNFYPAVTANPAPGTTIFTIPAKLMTKIYSLDTSGTSIVPIYDWSVSTSPQTGGSYNYTDPYLTTIMPYLAWGAFSFRTVDKTGAIRDYFNMGNPNVYPSTVYTNQVGQNMPNITVEWVEYADYIALSVYQN